MQNTENPPTIMDRVWERANAISTKVQTRLTQPSSWILPREESSIAPPGVWTNAGMPNCLLQPLAQLRAFSNNF